MRIPTSEHIKSDIIYKWLTGQTRDKIATEFNIAKGSVSNILKQWENKIGVYEANALRELGLALKKAEISPVQCTNGLRIFNIINQLGIDENHLFDFLQKLYDESKKQRLLPADIIRLVKTISEYPKINSLNDLPKNISKRRQEKIKLDADIYFRKQEINKLDQEIIRKRKEIQDLRDDFNSVREEMQNEKKEFLLFKDLKHELKKHDIKIQVLEPLLHVIKIFEEMHFKPLTILCEFSDINQYRDLVENKEKKIKELELHVQYLKDILDNYETKIASKEPIVQSLKNLESLGFDASDINNLERTFLGMSNKYNLNKNEIKIRFFKYIDRFYTFLTLEKDIFEKTNELSLLNSEISSGRRIIESQPIVFTILQNLVNSGLNEKNFLLAFNIFKKDWCNNMPFNESTYLERLSKDLDNYKTVRETLQGLNSKILLKKMRIDKLKIIENNLEALFSY